MLVKPSIIKLPEASFPGKRIVACNQGNYVAPGNGSKCKVSFSCNPYAYNSNDCVDCNYTTCSYTLGGTAITVVVTVGIAIAT